MVHQPFSLEADFKLKIQRGLRGFNVKQTVIPLVFEVNDLDASPWQGENQCNSPTMLALNKFLYFQSQA